MNAAKLSFPSRAAAFAALFLCAYAAMTAATKAVTAPVDGLRDASPRVHALVGGRIVIAPGKVIDSGTVVVRDGGIQAVGANGPLPAGARVWNVAGRPPCAGFLGSQ